MSRAQLGVCREDIRLESPRVYLSLIQLRSGQNFHKVLEGCLPSRPIENYSMKYTKAPTGAKSNTAGASKQQANNS